MKDAKLRAAHEVAMLLPTQDVPTISQEYLEDEMLKDYSFFVQHDTSDSTGVSLLSRVTELENEVGRLRDQLGKAKGINDVMWETMVQHLVENGKKETVDEAEDDSGRRRKRGRP